MNDRKRKYNDMYDETSFSEVQEITHWSIKKMYELSVTYNL